ncbi:HDOD domain-containing protein [Pleionea sediminis]|uniref:HDOD domain-containing protein n=1 Tax=Pleionea sediminis TaxID=2569479 RepID=UPI0013DDF0D6|nr:HDOD domain-containing protein [Pleionea sediminis]
MINIIQLAEKYPPLNQTVQRSLSQLNDIETSIEDVANTISGDASLVSSILKLANSPLYGIVKEVVSIKDACVLLGRHSIRNLIYSTSLFLKYEDTLPDFFDREFELNHAILSASIAKQIASDLNIDKDTAFTSAILHKMGKLVMVWADSRRYAQVIDFQNKFNEPDFISERGFFNHDHADVGASILTSWELPTTVVEAIAKYPTQYQEPNDPLSSAIALSSEIALSILNKNTSDISNSLNSDIVNKFQINKEKLQKIVEDAKLHLEQNNAVA